MDYTAELARRLGIARERVRVSIRHMTEVGDNAFAIDLCVDGKFASTEQHAVLMAFLEELGRASHDEVTTERFENGPMGQPFFLGIGKKRKP